MPPDAEDPKEEVPVIARAQPDVIGNRLKFSTSFKDEPLFEGQAKVYPDSVKVIDERYRMFDIGSSSDMDLYSTIRLSHRRAGRYVVISEESMQWNEQKGTWVVVMLVQERMFKTINTSDLDPSNL